jgi:hypothetical protein
MWICGMVAKLIDGKDGIDVDDGRMVAVALFMMF